MTDLLLPPLTGPVPARSAAEPPAPKAGHITCIEPGVAAFSTRYLSVRVDRVRFPDGRESDYSVVGDPSAIGGAVSIVRGRISDTDNGERYVYALTEQYRYPIGEVTIEFPSGGVVEHSAAEAAREVVEEVGVRPTSMTRIGDFWQASHRQSALASVWLAEVDLPDGIPDPHLDTETGGVSSWATAAEINAMILDGTFRDDGSLAAWTFYSLRRDA